MWGGYGADHFCVILIELCRYRVLYSFWDSGGAEGRALVFTSRKTGPLQVHQGYSLGRFGRLGVKSAALVQFGEFVCRLVTEMCVEMFFFSEGDSAFEGC